MANCEMVVKPEYTLNLNQEEAEYLASLLGCIAGTYDVSGRIFNALTNAGVKIKQIKWEKDSVYLSNHTGDFYGFCLGMEDYK